MKSVNVIKVYNVLAGISFKEGFLSFNRLKELCHPHKVSIDPVVKASYIKFGIMQKMGKRGYYKLVPDMKKLASAYSYCKETRKKYNKNTVKTKVFNQEKVDKTLTVKIATEFLKQRGFIVYKKEKGETIQVIRTL